MLLDTGLEASHLSHHLAVLRRYRLVTSEPREMRGAVRRTRVLLPSIADYTGLRKSWRTDLLAGVTVGIVVLQLALAFGVSSGVGAEAGLITAIIAALAEIESLLSVRVAATLADTGHLNADRELVGQGLASIATGFFGGMPATGALERREVTVLIKRCATRASQAAQADRRHRRAQARESSLRRARVGGEPCAVAH